MKHFMHVRERDRRQIVGGLLCVLVGVSVFVGIGVWRQQRGVETRGAKNGYVDDGGRQGKQSSQSDTQPIDDGKRRTVRLTYFDPNTADSTLLLSLGLQRWQVRNIYRYRNAGGVYSKPEDFARLYGLTAGQYRQLRPYIRISRDFLPASEVYGRNSNEARKEVLQNQEDGKGENQDNQDVSAQGQKQTLAGSYVKKLSKGETIDLNTSDTTMLKRVPGIGPYFARKIVRQRELLGGFMSRQQLLEITDFPESALPYFKEPSSTAVRRININKATAEQLRTHPYITYRMARAIIEYRIAQGKINDLNDLRLLPDFSKNTINRLRAYIEY